MDDRPLALAAASSLAPSGWVAICSRAWRTRGSETWIPASSPPLVGLEPSREGSPLGAACEPLGEKLSWEREREPPAGAADEVPEDEVPEDEPSGLIFPPLSCFTSCSSSCSRVDSTCCSSWVCLESNGLTALDFTSPEGP